MPAVLSASLLRLLVSSRFALACFGHKLTPVTDRLFKFNCAALRISSSLSSTLIMSSPAKKSSNGGKYLQMIIAAISDLKPARGGVSRIAIKKYIHDHNSDVKDSFIRSALSRGVEAGALKQSKDSFTLGSAKAKKAAAPAKAAAPNKAKTTKAKSTKPKASPKKAAAKAKQPAAKKAKK